ncbi:transglycosylase SLT domain-containing protein [Candidatus Halobeggiatoa sp. HSG11]|nr:transglycosylase SLT domain-containing protein [Candidatus Halobeggiatoa sp. HSG11]
MKKFYLLFLFTTLMTSYCSLASDLTSERWQFKQALDALNNKDMETFQQLSNELRNYPLYYYLRYKELKSNLKHVSASEIQTFLHRYKYSYFADKLRKDWLFQLVKQGDWNSFLKLYTPTKSVKLQCHNIHAQLATGNRINVKIAKKLWLVDHSQPKACDFVFDYLYQNSLISEADIWQRIELAAKKNRFKLVNSIAKRLASKTWVQLWNKMHKKPDRTLNNFAESDSYIARKIILHGIRRLAKKQFTKANKHWRLLQSKYAFSATQIGELQRDLAIASAKQDPMALTLLTAINKQYLNEKASITRIKLAMKQQNWIALADFITELPAKQQQTLQWRYWLARALEKTNKRNQARQIYIKLAQERDYYGFLAADRMGTEHKMQHKSILLTQSQQDKLMQNPSIARAYEFYRLSQIAGDNWLTTARQEWNYAVNLLTKNAKATAAALANRWGWHHQAIITVAQAGHYDDLNIRFPLLFYPQIKTGAEEQNVDLAWAYGIIRQESAFKTTALSRSGALGLMQLMPATGRQVARQIGIKLKNKQNILDINVNVSLGTAYLRQLLDKFDGNYMLATAGYNAGPNRAKRWAKENGCIPADIWVELIPFRETRKYVSRVLFYTSIFENRLGKNSRLPLRLAAAPSENCITK